MNSDEPDPETPQTGLAQRLSRSARWRSSAHPLPSHRHRRYSLSGREVRLTQEFYRDSMRPADPDQQGA